MSTSKTFSVLLFLFIFCNFSINAQDWQTDFEKSKEIAKDKNQNIILVFSGSDWCAPCIKLENNIWKSNEFKDYSKDNFVLLKADFPRKKKNKLSKDQEAKNSILAEKYNTRGFFPLVVILNSSGKVLGTTGYKYVSPKEYIEILESF